MKGKIIRSDNKHASDSNNLHLHVHTHTVLQQIYMVV